MIGRWYLGLIDGVESVVHLLGKCDKVEAKIPGAMIATISS